MDWWNFQDYTFLTFFIIVVLAIFFLVFLVLTFSLSNHASIKNKDEIISESTTVRIYIIDFKNNSVVYFNRSSISQKNRTSLSQFYLRFNEEEVDELKNWLYAICVENRAVDDYIEVDMNSIKGKDNYYSILKNVKFDNKTGLLHLESHLMRYISPKNEDARKSRGVMGGHVNKEDMKELVEKQKNLAGYTFCFRFFYLRNKIVGNDKIDRITTASLKDVIYSFTYKINRPRQILDESGSEIFLFDLSITDKEKALKLLTNITHELRKAIGIKGLSSTVGFAVGVVENAQYYQDFNAIIKTSQQACIYAQQHDLQSYFYTRANKLVLMETGKYSQEITRLLKPNNLKYTFRPIIDAPKRKVLGYFNYVNAPESPFNDFMEMSKYSAKVDRNKEFFAFVSKNVVNQYASEKNDDEAKLFISVSLTDVKYLYEIFSQIPLLKDIDLVLVFSERDFNEEEVDLITVYDSFASLRNLNIQLGLLMYDQNLLLDPSIYSNFDYFIVGSSMVKEIRKSKFIRVSIHTLVEQLLKYKKPIIATDIEGWTSIELIVNSGIDLISSETISPSSPMILPLEKKKVEKLAAISDIYQ